MVTPVTVRGGRGDKAASALSNQSLNLPGGNWDDLQVERNTSNFLLPAGTHWVENDILSISDRVNQITNGKCRVASCTCGNCVMKGHFPHVVVELTRSGKTAPVFGFTEFGEHVLHRLREIHVSQEPNKKSEENNRRVREQARKNTDAHRREKLEIIQAALDSPKHDWRGPGGIRTKG